MDTVKKNILAGLASALLLTGCGGLKLNIVNTNDSPIRDVEIKIGDSVTKLPEMAAGAVYTPKLKVTKPSWVNVNFTNAKGQQAYTSAPIELKPSDSGWVQLSITAKLTLEAADGRKK